MDCPQCGAEVPNDDAFCGKCGYAMRDQGPERVDQSRIRLHEEPDPATSESDPPPRGASPQRVRKHTVMGMPSAVPPKGGARPESGSKPPPPTEISTARDRARKRTPQKTMMGIPRPELPQGYEASSSSDAQSETSDEGVPVERFSPPAEPEIRSHRTRARVRYDSANEPYPMLKRRKNALRALALLVAVAAAWLAYRYLSLHG